MQAGSHGGASNYDMIAANHGHATHARVLDQISMIELAPTADELVAMPVDEVRSGHVGDHVTL